jgi:hypothetical protein
MDIPLAGGHGWRSWLAVKEAMLKRTSGRFLSMAAALFIAVAAGECDGTGPSLKVEITATQSRVLNLQDFGVRTKIENEGKEDLILHVSQCWYSAMQWTTDKSSVHVKNIPCKKNESMDIHLKPGEANEGVLPVHISLEPRELATSTPVSFRLGFLFKRGEPILAGPAAGPTTQSASDTPIWSNAVTVTVHK